MKGELPEYKLESADFTPLETGLFGMKMRIQVSGGKFPTCGTPLMAQIGAQRVSMVTVSPFQDGFDGFLAQIPNRGDRLMIGFGSPDMFRTNIVFEGGGGGGDRPPVLACRSFQELHATEGGGIAEAINRTSTGYVKWLQNALNRFGGATLKEDGDLGPKTRKAISAFQSSRGLKPDGLVSSATELALLAAGAPLPPGAAAGPFIPPFDKRQPDLSKPCAEPPAEILEGFGVDESALTPQHRAQLDRVAQAIIASWDSPTPVHLAILEGHADEQGARDYNLKLGERRARSAAEALRVALDSNCPGLSSRLGILETSAGEDRPVAENNTEQGRVRNRRVEICLNRLWRT